MGFLSQSFAKQRIDPSRAMRAAEQVAEKIATVTRPERIILFGSTVDGSFTQFSDIDLLIVYSDRQTSRSSRRVLAKQRLVTEWPIDFVVMTREQFDRYKDEGGVAYVAHHEGRVLYDKEP